MPHAFRHAVSGSTKCGACGHERNYADANGQLYHFAVQVTPPMVRPAPVQENTASLLGLVANVAVDIIEDAVFSDVVQEDAPTLADAFMGDGGGFGGGGASDGW